MKTFSKICLTIAVVGYGLWQLTFPAWTIRYRLTLVAEVDGRQIAGSGVVETHWRSQELFEPLTHNSWSTSFRGEAVVVDLGKPGLLFALLRGDQSRKRSPMRPEELVTRVSADARRVGATRGVLRAIAASGDPVPIPLDELPLLVRFRDIADPRSVEQVDPNNLAQKFGPGVRLQSASLAVVSNGWWPFDWFGWPKMLAGEPVTKKIHEILPWLDDKAVMEHNLVPVRNKQLHEYTIEETLYVSSFALN